MKYIDKLHNCSLRVLTLCGIGAVISLAVNICTALTMFAVERVRRQEQ